MKFNKQIVISLVLLSLLFSALGAAYYFYSQNQKNLLKNDKLRVVLVSAKDIKKNKKITKDDIKKVQIATKYILTTPLLEKEIVGKIAKDNIYKNDMFRKEKLTVKVDTGQSDIMKYKNNSYNMSFALFSNPNFSLEKGDYINIVSVYPQSLKRENLKYDVQYTAINVKIIGFLEKGRSVKHCFRSVKQKVKTKKKKAKDEFETVTVFADEVVVDIDDDVLLGLIKHYNKGKQLWMVKTKFSTIKKEVIKKEEKPVEAAKVIKTIVKKPKVIKKVKKTIYNTKWFVPRNTTTVKRATIRYANTNDVIKSDKVTMKSNDKELCSKDGNLLIGISNNVDLRQTPSMRSKLVRRIHKNYIIPYKRLVSPNWYEICNGLYVHKNEVKKISQQDVKKKLAWNKK